MKKSSARPFTSIAALLLALALLFSACTGEPTAPAGAETYELTILATNDLHGHIDTLPDYAAIIERVRGERAHVLLLDAGDLFRRGPHEEERGAVELVQLNKMGYDALVLGNGDIKVPYDVDGKDRAEVLKDSEAQIANLAQWAQFPILCGNVTLQDTGAYMENILPYLLLKAGELTIGVIGVTNMQPAERKMAEAVGKDFVRGDRAVKQLLPEVRAGSDIQIVLSHASWSVDNRIKGVSAIIGGHDHKILENAKTKQGIPVTQGGGEDEHYLSRLDLTFARIDGKWILQDSFGSLIEA